MRVLLHAPVGGLGDVLLYSTLPELYAKAGHEVFLTTATSCRNPEVHELVYGKNPYIAGVSDEGDIQAGSCHAKAFFRHCRLTNNPIGLVERLHGFEPENDRPKIYYTPKRLSEWQDTMFVDPRSISQGFPANVVDRWIDRMRYAMDPKPVIFVAQSQYSGPHGGGSLLTSPRHAVNSIYDYIDIIFSCKYFFVVESGGHMLAGAIRRHGIYSLWATRGFNSRFFTLPDVVYDVTGRLSDDYIDNDLIGNGLFV